MPAKEQKRNNESEKAKRRSPQPTGENPVQIGQLSHPATIIQQSRLDPGSLNPGDIRQLQRMVGNQAVGQILAPTRSPGVAQPELMAETTPDQTGQPADQPAEMVIEQPFPESIGDPVAGEWPTAVGPEMTRQGDRQRSEALWPLAAGRDGMAAVDQPAQATGPIMTKPAQNGRGVADRTVRFVPQQGYKTGPVQRGKWGRFGKAQLMGLNKTVNPFFGWKGYYKSMKDIIVGQDAAVKYGSRPWRVMNGLVETSDRVASLATALAFVLTGLGSILAPFYGAGAAILGVATICGIVATIAHAVTFLLRGIVTIYDAVRMLKLPEGDKNRAMIKGKLFQDIGGLISNGIGVIFGGLGGGFIGGTNVIGGALGKAIGDAAAAPVGALAGEGANRIADTAAAVGGIKQHKYEKRYEAADSSPTIADSPPTSSPTIADSPPTSSPAIADNPSTSSPTVEDDMTTTSESDSTEVGPEAVQDLSGIEEAVKAVSEKDKLHEVSQTQGSGQLQKATQQIGELLGKKEELSTTVEQAQVQSETGMSEADQKLKASKGELKEGELKQLETTVADLENTKLDDPEGGSGETATVEATAEATVDETPETPVTATTSTTKTEEEETEKTPVTRKPVQRGLGSKIKGAFGKLFARFVNVRKRIKKLGQKVKMKLMRILVKVMGLKPPLQESQLENKAALTELPEALTANKQNQATAQTVLEQVEQAKNAIKTVPKK